jgi:hypothetical protein
MELGNHVWRYAIRRGDDDPARAAFVEQVEARLRTESSQERRRQGARKATETLREKLRAAGIDPHTYYSRLAQRGNAARWRKQDAAPPASEARDDGAQTEAGPPASEAAPAEVGAEAGQARVQATEAPEARQGMPRRTGTLPVYLL